MTMTPIHLETVQLRPRTRLLEKGKTELTIAGLGRCRFYRATVDHLGAVLELDVVDPRNGGIRTVVADRAVKIHRTEKLR